MSKCKNAILNEMVNNVVHLIDGKIEYNTLVAEQFEKAGRFESADVWRKSSDEMKIARNILVKYEGCWV